VKAKFALLRKKHTMDFIKNAIISVFFSASFILIFWWLVEIKQPKAG